jgi:hypothetical protein
VSSGVCAASRGRGSQRRGSAVGGAVAVWSVELFERFTARASLSYEGGVRVTSGWFGQGRASSVKRQASSKRPGVRLAKPKPKNSPWLQ